MEPSDAHRSITMTTIPARTAASSTAPVAFWTAADGQRDLDMAGITAAEAVEMLLDQCADDEQREGILDGSFTVVSE
jgi:hypothetical protein